eukprot:CAMPEP_0115707132 /NCGR_PEP_ID=MMETSP0272-20121206/71176_1 /TAXON_ID=71861 /ORGANISM="Scrippsiella trochoidea, Strain CCMP3099" /LENGTH=83 /DNA_ID=CAMNT_0003148457 /DNA_START=153 /DNA_END=404 /DNA_ORIENTATION=-
MNELFDRSAPPGSRQSNDHAWLLHDTGLDSARNICAVPQDLRIQPLLPRHSSKLFHALIGEIETLIQGLEVAPWPRQVPAPQS